MKNQKVVEWDAAFCFFGHPGAQCGEVFPLFLHTAPARRQSRVRLGAGRVKAMGVPLY
jgi:hypothetical protein